MCSSIHLSIFACDLFEMLFFCMVLFSVSLFPLLCFAAMVLKLQSLIYGQWRQIGMSKWMREQSTIPYMMRCIFPSWLTNATLMRAIIFLKLNNRMFEDDIFHLYSFAFLYLSLCNWVPHISSIRFWFRFCTDTNIKQTKSRVYFILFCATQYHIHIYY